MHLTEFQFGQGGSDWSAPLLTPEQLAYAANDVAHLHALKTRLAVELDAVGLSAVFQMEMDLLPVVREMEGRGFAVDSARLREILVDATKTAEASRAKVQRELGIANPSSQKQVLAALNKLRLDLPKTDAETLKECDHPAAVLVLAYREADKRRRQAQTLLEHVQADSRIHGRFNPMGADSGRFSSSEPNLQNVGRGDHRRRLLPNGSGDDWLRFTSLVNTPVQGAAADAMKKAMVTLARSLPVGAGIVSTVHDELIVETPVESAEDVQKLVSSNMIAAMESFFPQVPIEVDAKICCHWGEK